MRNICSVLNIVLALLLLSIAAGAERLPVRTYTVADGALRDSVHRIRRDSHGFLWLCSAEGISFFDGYKFTNLTTAQGLPNRFVNDFLHSRKGNYWIATDGGLALLDVKAGNRFTVYQTPGSHISKITVLHEDDHGVWVGTGDGLYQFDEAGSFVPLILLSDGDREPVYVTALLRDASGSLWVGTDTHGLFRVQASGAVDRFDRSDGLPNDNISALTEDSKRRVWVGSRYLNAKLYRLKSHFANDGQIVERIITRSDGRPNGWILSIHQASDGEIWVGTGGGGLCRVSDKEELECDRYKAINNICDAQIWSITEDNDENLWLGTQCGTKKWSKYGFTSYGMEDGLPYPSVSSVLENDAGEIFVTIGFKGLPVGRFNGKRFDFLQARFPPHVGTGWGWKQVAHYSRKKEWWFATNDGVYKIPYLGRFEDFAAARPVKLDIVPKSEIFRIFEDSRGDVWVQTYGTPTLLLRWDRIAENWIDHTSSTGISPSRLATAFVEDHHGNLWIATGGDHDDTALLRYRDGKFDVFTKQHSEFIAGWLRDIFVDPNGRLWIASNATGVLRLDDLNATEVDFTRYGTEHGLSTTVAYTISGDRFGRIYVGSGRGIDRIAPSTGQVENFSTADGLPSAEVWTSYADSKGQLWFATTQGLARYAPEPPRERKPPTVFISGFRVLGEPKPVSIFGEPELPNFNLTSDQRQINIDFFGLGSSIGERLRYEYRLPGIDWSAADGNSVNLANLSPGEYTFEVRAVTADRLASAPAIVTFRIAAPIWQQWWFLLLTAIALVLLASMIYRSRLARLLELERTRTRIATDLHDDIGSNLSKISLLSEIVSMKMANGKPESERMLMTIAEISRSSIDSMRDIVWSINPERDSVLELTRRMREHAEDTCVPKDIIVDFEPERSLSDTRLSMETRREMFLIFKEAVNNAVRHSGCTKLSIDLKASGSEIQLTIADNGSGFDLTAASDGNGLRNMKTRAEKMKGRFLMSSTPGGTSINVWMPI